MINGELYPVLFTDGKIQYCKVESLTSKLSICLLKFQSYLFFGIWSDEIKIYKRESQWPRIAKKILKNNKVGRFDDIKIMTKLVTW